MLSAYTANLTANLTVSTLTTPLSKLGDLKTTGLMFGVPADSSVSRYFRDGKVGRHCLVKPLHRLVCMRGSRMHGPETREGREITPCPFRLPWPTYPARTVSRARC